MKRKATMLYCKNLGHVQTNCNKQIAIVGEKQNNLASTSKLLYVVIFVSKVEGDNYWLVNIGAT
jgi:hypothetical protein